jgi:C4-dicarboxylate-specific signal transduction histidine kinase
VLNRKLERINGAAQSSTLELLDSTGLAVAASNWNTSNSYVGHNYAFRPYFSQTRSQGTGRFYAVGVTSGIPGYFLSSAVLDERGSFLGAMVVKLEFPELEREWSQGTTCWSAMRGASCLSPINPAGAIATCARCDSDRRNQGYPPIRQKTADP